MAGAARLRLLVGLGVIAFHVALFVLLRGSTGAATRPTGRPAQPLTTLRLLPWPTTPQVATEAKTTPSARGPRAAAAISVTAPSTAVQQRSAAAPTQADASSLPALPASQPPRALDLTLPRGFATRSGARNPALDDARANSAHLTPEQRMAETFDTRVVEEAMGDGRRRLRQGANCVIVTPSRIAQLMPFNDSATRTPSMVSACP